MLRSVLFVVILPLLFIMFRKSMMRALLVKAWQPGASKRTMALVVALFKLLSPRAPRTQSFRDVLPPLPVPKLDDTLQRFLRSVSTLVPQDEYERTVEAVARFKAGPARTMQAALEQRARDRGNWLSDWWLQLAYLKSRSSVVINSNTAAIDSFDLPPPAPRFRRAAGIVTGALAFWRRVHLQQLKPLRAAGVLPMDMSAYSIMFGTTRLPGQEMDTLQLPEQPHRLLANAHIVVSYGSRMFRVPVVVDHAVASLDQLETVLSDIVTRCGDDMWSGPNVAMLTTWDRASWAAVRDHLAAFHTDNLESLDAVSTALFCVALYEHPVATREEAFRHSLYGDGRRVWADKCMTFHAFSDGHVALSMEHSWADAGPPSHMWETILATEQYPAAGGRVPPLAAAVPLQWHVSEQVTAAITDATAAFQQLSAPVDVAVLPFLEFGKDLVKTFRMSPDAFVQVAIQVAGHQYFGRAVLTYESGSTRCFHQGRTECIRGATPEANEFAKAMLSGETDKAQLVELLKTATRVHAAQAQAAIRGHGVDRHLLGLLMIARTTGHPVPDLFALPAFNLSFLLSTSQPPLAQEFVGSKAKLYPLDKKADGGGFGPVTKGGVGVSYFIDTTRIMVFLSCNSATPAVDCRRFCGYLEKALKDMAALMTK